MGKFEKDMVRFIRIHKQCDKARLIQNMNKVMQEKGIKRRNKCIWIAEITGVPVGSVNTWFTTAKCRDNNRIPPDAMCLLALALKVPVWRFLEGEEEKQKDPDHVERISEMDIRTVYPVTIGRRFNIPDMINNDRIKVAVSSQKVIRTLAGQGDCVIVGRCADFILQDMSPLNLFVYADKESKISRCLERAKDGETPKMIEQTMRKIDRDRAAFHELLTDKKWGQKGTYHLCINTSGREIKQLVPALAEFVWCWFEEGGKTI